MITKQSFRKALNYFANSHSVLVKNLNLLTALLRDLFTSPSPSAPPCYFTEPPQVPVFSAMQHQITLNHEKVYMKSKMPYF